MATYMYSRNKSHHHQDHICSAHTLPWVKRVNLIIVLHLTYAFVYISAVLQYFNAIINVNRMLICIPYRPWNMIFGQPVCSPHIFGSQLNIIFCLLYNSTRLSSTCLWGAKTCFFSFIFTANLSFSIPRYHCTDWTLCYTHCFV